MLVLCSNKLLNLSSFCSAMIHSAYVDYSCPVLIVTDVTTLSQEVLVISAIAVSVRKPSSVNDTGLWNKDGFPM